MHEIVIGSANLFSSLYCKMGYKSTVMIKAAVAVLIFVNVKYTAAKERMITKATDRYFNLINVYVNPIPRIQA
tara:strand:- start:385 stop:603 length:219 start_codon:yes stop_codon:yes gene_type:complete